MRTDLPYFDLARRLSKGLYELQRAKCSDNFVILNPVFVVGRLNLVTQKESDTIKL